MKKSKWNLVLQLFFALTLFLSLQACGENKKDKPKEKPEVARSDDKKDKEGFTQIFDGKTLDGWEGDPTHWSVKNGNLIGEVTAETLLKNNTFIIWKGGQPEDFELKLEVKIAESGNSGINYRSEKIDSIPYALRGYQADIDGKNTYTGQNYEEKKRATLAYRGEKVLINSQDQPDHPESLRANVKNNCWQRREVVSSLGDSDSLKTKINSENWNEIHLVIRGNRMQHYVNDVLMSDVTDNDTLNRKVSGYLGVQVHVGPPMTVEYRNIRLRNF